MLRTAIVLFALVPVTWAQAVISAHSGMVNYVEGDVQIAGKPVKLDGAIFPDVKIGQVLSTEDGRAEVLLTPGVFLRLDNNTSFRMISNKLTDTQVEILKGSALVGASEILKDNRIVVKTGNAETVLLKSGLYHFNADAGQVRAFDGKVQVSDGSNSALSIYPYDTAMMLPSFLRSSSIVARSLEPRRKPNVPRSSMTLSLCD